MTEAEAIKTLEKSMECHDRKVCGITEDCDECPLYADKDAEYEAHKVLLECLEERNELIEKIRAEIKKEYLTEGHSLGYWDGIDKCLQIIDKYRKGR